LEDILRNYIPANSVAHVTSLIKSQDLRLKISKPRKTKLGDYRAPAKGLPHRISVNGNLNPYLFLITFLHEYAHLITYNKHKRRAEPHGSEWKSNYSQLVYDFIDLDVFPKDLKRVLIRHAEKPGAGHYTNTELVQIMHQYDEGSHTLLQDLAFGDQFAISGTRAFVKGKLARSRFRCQSLDNGKWYFVHKLAPVTPIIQSETKQ